MSELAEKNEKMKNIPEISDGGVVDAGLRDGEPCPSSIEGAYEQNNQFPSEIKLEKTDLGEKSCLESTTMLSVSNTDGEALILSANQIENNLVQKVNSDDKDGGDNDLNKESNKHHENDHPLPVTDMKEAKLEDDHFNETPLTLKQEGSAGGHHFQAEGLNQAFSFDPHYSEGDDSGTEEEQAAFMKELENFFRENSLDFKPPKFYGEGLNCLKLWRGVTRLGGYDQVTQCKLWRQVGESFKPPKTCTTVSWSFRCFYEKALLEYEKHKVRAGELLIPVAPIPEPTSVDNQAVSNQASGSGRARRDAAARAMQGWHSQRMLGNGEVGDPIIKDKGSVSLFKKDKHLKSIGQSLKRKKASIMDRGVKVARTKNLKPHWAQARDMLQAQFWLLNAPKKVIAYADPNGEDSMVVDVGAPADWVKINVRRTKDCYEVYALVPGLLREEVHVQSDPAGRLIISGEPEQPDNPWGVTPFKKVITLPSHIDPHQTSAVVTLHGQLFVRAPFEQQDL